MSAWTNRGPCQECGASDSDCDDADYLTGRSCCDQCHHAHNNSERWSSLSRSAPYVSRISALFDDPEAEEEDE